MHGKLELTPICNLNCKMCYVHLDNNSYGYDRLMTVEKWISLICAAHEMGMMDVVLTGGECLTYPGFDDIYMYLINHGIWVEILSNGILMNEERICFFKKYVPKKGIQITLYGSNEKAYEAVTGQRVFGIVWENIQRMRDAGLPVWISLTPNAYMQDDPEALIHVVEELKVPYFINFAMLPPRKETGRKMAEVSDEWLLSLFRARSKYRNIQITPPEPCNVPAPNQICFGEPPEGVHCGAGKNSFAILHDGRMSPCTGMDFVTTEPLKQGFPEAWRELNEKMKHYQRPAECDGCAYQKVCSPCPALHQGAPRGHCDTRICTRIHKLITAGLF